MYATGDVRLAVRVLNFREEAVDSDTGEKMGSLFFSSQHIVQHEV